ncbi:hypothetical protein [Quadrisphaera sp. INWT6]|uniref:hypothetical protein n=1 Tax=Quadrisphaera sp. INWT6 TaxID=2596917 RepID=UPI00189266EA|nr:hypothetical protein [Quadrisphaera sp. INWT6]MBF5080869.1 hypothetical protein [Quadrisphaera sp. INWT6]
MTPDGQNPSGGARGGSSPWFCPSGVTGPAVVVTEGQRRPADAVHDDQCVVTMNGGNTCVAALASFRPA